MYRLNPKLQQLILLAPLHRPVPIRAPDSHPPVARQLLQQILDGIQPHIFVVNQNRYIWF